MTHPKDKSQHQGADRSAPRPPDNRIREISLRFRVDENELHLIEQKMRAMGIRNREAYLRKMAIDGYMLRLDLPEIRELIVQLRKYGTNVNQIAKRINSGGEIRSAEIEQLRQYHEVLFARVSDLLRNLAAL